MGDRKAVRSLEAPNPREGIQILFVKEENVGPGPAKKTPLSRQLRKMLSHTAFPIIAFVKLDRVTIDIVYEFL